MMNAPRPRPRPRQAGFSLMEVLVTIVVVALGLLGFAALQANSLKSNTVALQRSYATMLAYDIIDSMRANEAVARAGDYDIDFDVPATAGSVAGDDLVAWQAALAANLPAGQGQISVNAAGLVSIHIQWREVFTTEQYSGDPLSFETQTSL